MKPALKPLRALVLVSVAALTIRCSDSTAPRPLDNSIGVIVSGLVEPPPGAAAAAQHSPSVVATGFAYVSLPPSGVPAGIAATLTNRHNNIMVTTAMENGGFDPVAIAANVGDTLAVDITTSSPGTVKHAQLVVAARRPPRIVRTNPPSGGRDVPLNTTIVVVFSEPIDSAALSDGSIRLLRDTTSVAGTLRFGDADQLRGEFHPSSLLASETTYRLQLSTRIRSLTGVALDAPLDVVFTTSPATGLVFAVGTGGTILRYDGTRWTRQLSDSTIWTLNGVWGAAANDVFAVGSAGSILHYDGVNWSRQNSNTTIRLLAVWGNSGTDVFAVGEQGTVLHYDGTTWTQQMRDSTFWFNGVWGTASNNVYAVTSAYQNGQWSGTILHYDGTRWTTQRTMWGGWLFGVWGSSPTDVFVVGDSILHYDGTSWTPQRDAALDAVWGLSGHDVFAVGDYASVMHYDGTSWTLQIAPGEGRTPSEFDGVWGSSGTDVFTVGQAGAIWHYDGTRWTEQTRGATDFLWSVWGTSSATASQDAGR